tara:strand:+ start:248 stop:571 length:324 start_codon:yes stop_codon:yes gene_type:complete
MSDLKPCPFCGCKEVNIEAAGDCGDLFSVMCKCGVESDYAECREDAIGQWNKRTTDRLEQENAELREALQALVKVEHERGGALSASGSFQYPVPEGVFRQAKELLNK